MRENDQLSVGVRTRSGRVPCGFAYNANKGSSPYLRQPIRQIRDAGLRRDHSQKPRVGSSRPVLTQHYAMLQRNLLYTGVTRGKRLVVLVGQKRAVAILVRNVSGRRRWSKLAEWLRPGLAD
jgi:hypothetical protein